MAFTIPTVVRQLLHWRHFLWMCEKVEDKTPHVIYQSYQQKKLNQWRLVSFLIGWTGAKLQALKGRCPKSVWCAHACACSGCYRKLRLPYPTTYPNNGNRALLCQPGGGLCTSFSWLRARFGETQNFGRFARMHAHFFGTCTSCSTRNHRSRGFGTGVI